MLDELKKFKYNGGKDGLLFFLCDVVGQMKISVQDAEVICSHAPGKRHLSVEDIVSYCLAFGWIDKDDDTVSVSLEFAPFLDNRDVLNERMVQSTVKKLFLNGVLNPQMFSYDSIRCEFLFKNELLPLSLSCVRNVLISQGFLISLRDSHETRFYVAPAFEELVAKNCISARKKLSLEGLKRKLEDNEIAGEKAETYVLAFEKERVGFPRCDSIKRVSEVDVMAGYDIVSFDSCESQKPDRFIEVKAISNSGFFWSNNEYEIAKLMGDSYYLYLVELGRINEPGYVPRIIQNPAENVVGGEEWLIEPQSYHVKPV